MGWPTAIVTGISVISGISQARSAKRAAKKTQQAIGAAPGRALESLGQFEQQFGGPPGFERLTGGDYEALQRSLYEQQTGLFQPQFEESQRRIFEDAARRGLPSSIISETQEGLGRTRDLALQQAAASSVGQRYGLQAEELARLNAFQQQQYQSRLGGFTGLAGTGTQGAIGAGQVAQQGIAQVGGALGGIGAAAGALISGTQNRAFQQNLLNTLGGTPTGTSPFIPAGTQPFQPTFPGIGE